MDPFSVIISASAAKVLDLVDWKKVGERLVTDALRDGAKGLFRRLQPTEREKSARDAVALFVQEFVEELTDKLPLSAALEGYLDDVKRLVEHASQDIAEWLQPEVTQVDLQPLESMWSGMNLARLPEGFEWRLVGDNYARALRKYVRHNPLLRDQLALALQERIAGPAAGFDLAGYRKFLKDKCGAVMLAAMHSSTYSYDRRITLWSVFVPQSARESVPTRDIPREVLRRLRAEGQVGGEAEEWEVEEQRRRYQESTAVPVLDVLKRERLVAVLGDPGSGKTSLLKYLALRWAREDQGPVPFWIDLKEYVQDRRDGFVAYLQSGCTSFRMEASQIEDRLQTGNAVLYLDGLDEIFDGPVRGSVVEAIAAAAARYVRAGIVVTSRILGYEPERLRSAGFVHATLEDFDEEQILEFLKHWHLVAEDSQSERSRLQGQIERALQDSAAVRRLAGNPLLLTMMAILNRNQDLPRDRVELYREASRVLLHEWDARRFLPKGTFDRHDKEELLRELAGLMQQMEGGLAGNLVERDRLLMLFRNFLSRIGVANSYDKANDLVRQLTERNFILCFAGAERFSFVHRTFLEFYCADWFVKRFQVKQDMPFGELRDLFARHWRDEAWHEVLRLIVGMVEPEHADELIRFLIDQDGLTLAAFCLSEVRNRSAIRETDQELCRRFLEVKVIRAAKDAANGIDPEVMQMLFGQTDLEKALKILVLVWPGETTLDWLRNAVVRSTSWTLREAALIELARLCKDDPRTKGLLKERGQSDRHQRVRQAALSRLAREWKEDPEVRPLLESRVSKDRAARVRLTAVRELAKGWGGDSKLLSLLKQRARCDNHESVREAAILGVVEGWRTDPETLLLLKDRARSDESEWVRKAAKTELLKGWKADPEVQTIVQERSE